MPWAVITAAASLAVGIGLGWPLGAAVVAGCLLLTLAVTRAMAVLFCPLRRPATGRRMLRVTAVRLTAAAGEVGDGRKVILGRVEGDPG